MPAETLTIGAPPPPDIGDMPTPPENDPGAPGALDGEELPELLSEGMVRSLLESCALLAGMVANPVHAPGLWRFEPGELDLLAPAVTRIANRTPVLRAALIQGDWITVALVMGGYSARNLNTWRQASAEQHREDQPSLRWDGSDPRRAAGVGVRPTGGADARNDAPLRPPGPLGDVRR